MIEKWHLGLHLSSNSDFHFHPLNQGFHYFYGLPLSNGRFCELGGYSGFFPGSNQTNILIAQLIIGITLHICYLSGLISKFAFYFLLTLIVLITFVISAFLTTILQFNCFVMKNFEVVEQPTILENLTMRFTDEAVNFVRAKTIPSYCTFHLPKYTPLYLTHDHLSITAFTVAMAITLRKWIGVSARSWLLLRNWVEGQHICLFDI